MKSAEIFRQNDGEVTKRYYAALDAKGPFGQIATALFRAQKRSTAAKKYRGRKYRDSSYEVKTWSMGELCRLLLLHGEALGIGFGWKQDERESYASWVLYVDLPFGQCSFHCPKRLDGPDYTGDWDKQHASEARILAFCDAVFFDVWENCRDRFPVKKLSEQQPLWHKEELF